MKKAIIISALLSVFGTVQSAPNQANNNSETTFIDDRFLFDDDDIDPTTAFISLGDIQGDIDAYDVIAYAKNYLGRPYVWGSKGPKSFDCSGFTSYVFKNFDINLSPSSRTQSTQGERIDRKDIRPGDLIFFQGRRSRGVGHVGLAIDVDETGDISFIHASVSGGVRIDKLSKDYYNRKYICARRVLN